MTVVLLGSSEVGLRIGVTPERVRQLARAGELIPAVVASSGARLYDPLTVQAFIEARRARGRK